ncbi:uncharacterized protein RHOBADRAFT_45985 [Rhodotorula graminis WP1]|uniref:carbonic anhydrase n=1 Tax=Rhodotorula graminis (strain WP1) TaxID=578459 RepID=A0A0P9EW17_RHOGW|nr:uncharacterized protein RHOBADRAFT_45985 [Rhodotorula graminis WP1]KPV73408.1 hypothetical protein RHOBADRAFT_45985 [Rhodotorula graminis WP1]
MASGEHYRDNKGDSSASDSDADLTDDLGGAREAFEDERSQRRARQAARQARSRQDEKEEKPVRVMRSLGLNKTTMHKLLHPHSSQGSGTDDESLLAQQKRARDDPEAQAPARRRASAAAAASPRRRVYIAVVVLCLVILIGIGAVLGVLYAKRTQERAASEAADSQRMADKAALDAQGEAMQSSLGMASGGPHGTATTGAAAHGLATTPLDAALPSPTGAMQRFPELQALFAANQEWVNETMATDPTLIPSLAKAQKPKLAYVGCSDSRVPETTILHTKPGELFVTRNIGNQYLVDDLSSETVLSYAVAHVAVQHIIVMGHTSCGAVKAAIADSSDEVLTNMDETRIDTWLRPIRSLYATSTRPEIASFRNAHKDKKVTGDDVTSEVWRAVVEENVKLNVQRVAVDSTVQRSWAKWSEGKHASSIVASGAASSTSMQGHRLVRRASEEPVELWVHGWLYDLDTGLVQDLGVSVGPSA